VDSQARPRAGRGMKYISRVPDPRGIRNVPLPGRPGIPLQERTWRIPFEGFG